MTMARWAALMSSALGKLGRAITWLPRQIGTVLRRAISAPNDPVAIFSFGALLLAVGVILIAAIIEVWPAVATTSSAGNASKTVAASFVFGLFTINLTVDTSLLALVVVAASIGAYVHAATSFADFVGNRRFVASWTWWYALRMFIGVSLALLLYFAVRAGFLSGGSSSTSVNPYGVAALAGLSGLFSKQATDKLREVFETMFKVSDQGGDALRKDDLENPVPAITATEPSQATAGQSLRIAISGSGFVAGTALRVAGRGVDAKLSEATGQLDAEIPAALVTGDSLELIAVSPPPGGGGSAPFVIPVVP
jgi:hypothetical protein